MNTKTHDNERIMMVDDDTAHNMRAYEAWFKAIQDASLLYANLHVTDATPDLNDFVESVHSIVSFAAPTPESMWIDTH